MVLHLLCKQCTAICFFSTIYICVYKVWHLTCISMQFYITRIEHRIICFLQTVDHTMKVLRSYCWKPFIAVYPFFRMLFYDISSGYSVLTHLLLWIEPILNKPQKWQTKTERKSPLFDGYKQAGQHSIVLFWYSTYNSKLGHWGQPPIV